jgi:arylsulfate sulfotransferase
MQPRVLLAMQASPGLTVQLEADHVSGQAVGTTIHWLIRATGTNPVTYRIRIAHLDGRVDVLVDYRADNIFTWVPIREGPYFVAGTVRDSVTGETAQAVQEFAVTSRPESLPVVTPTSHPLVVLYSAPPCPVGLEMRILFGPPDDEFSRTDAQRCDGVTSMNFYVAGLRAETRYSFFMGLFPSDRTAAPGSGPPGYRDPDDEGDEAPDFSVELSWETGGIGTPLIPLIQLQAPDASSSQTEKVVLQSPATDTVLADGQDLPVRAVPFASDLNGRTLWYYPGDPDDHPLLLRPLRGGTLLVTVAQGDLEGQVLREIDLAGRVVRETNRRRVSDELEALGHDRVTAFHHEALRLPSGHTAVLASAERILQDAQGSVATDVLGDMVVLLDADWQVAWVWNPFVHLDVTRRARLAETCVPGQPGCQPFFRAGIANDWTHTNAITYSSADGNLLLSMRNQDWIVKIDYRNGEGTGAVLWRLGPEGDFTIRSEDPWSWFSHQHDPRFVDPHHLVVYDNGNTRCAEYYDLCYSRGQVYELDETNHVAVLTLNAHLGKYAYALGSSQPLANGNVHFNSGIHAGTAEFVATSEEVTRQGARVYALRARGPIYRSWRLTDLYMTGGQGGSGP